MSALPGPISERMDDRTALHTAARRYCEDRFSNWAEAYDQLEAREGVKENKLKPGWDYTDEEYGIFPRYRIDKAIRTEVERLSPQSSNDLEELRSQLIKACDIAEARLSVELNNTIAHKAVRAEAEDYKAYIRVLREGDLVNVAPLPYKRVITAEESKRIRDRLKAVWGIGEGYWFPLREGPVPPNVIAFHADYFKQMDGLGLLHEALTTRGVSRVFELHESGLDEPDCEIELSILKPAYCWGEEQYCTDQTVDWVAYVSHESSITIAGHWLTEIFKEKWPGCTQRTYGGPFWTEDLRGTWKWE